MLKTSWQSEFSGDHISGIEKYKEEISRSFPDIPDEVVNGWSLFVTDALALGYFLNQIRRSAFVFEVGTFFGVSTFLFASHPNVSKVVSIDPNPKVADQLVANSNKWEREAAIESLQSISVLDVAYRTLSKFPRVEGKVELVEGVVGSTSTGVKKGPTEGIEKIQVPEAAEDEMCLAFVDGLHTRKGVLEDLKAIFGRNPTSVVFLDDCRHAWGQFVQAGVVDFMEEREEQFNFELIGDLSPSLASSNLGVLYPRSSAYQVDEALNNLKRSFSGRLDTLRLLGREAELVAEVNRLNEDKNRLQKDRNQLQKQLLNQKARVPDLEKQMARMRDRRAYKAVDSMVNLALRVPGADKFLRSKS